MGPGRTQPLTTLCTPKNPAVITASPATMAGSEPGSVTSTPAAARRQLAAHDGTAGETARHPPGEGRAEAADRVDEEDQPGRSRAEAKGRAGEPEAHRVEDGHEGAHRAAPDGVERQQPRIGHGPPEHRRQRPGADRRGREVARRRQREQDHGRAGQPHRGDRGQRPPPADRVGDRAGDQAAGQPAQGGAGDVQARGPRVRAGMGSPRAGRGVAAAGSPARALPWTSRRLSSTPRLGAMVQASATRPEAVSERRMSRVSPILLGKQSPSPAARHRARRWSATGSAFLPGGQGERGGPAPAAAPGCCTAARTSPPRRRTAPPPPLSGIPRRPVR